MEIEFLSEPADSLGYEGAGRQRVVRTLTRFFMAFKPTLWSFGRGGLAARNGPDRLNPMHWYYLLIAIVSEVCGTVCMKLSAGFTRLLPSVLLFLFYGIAFCFLTLALKKLPVSTAYAIWSGLGTALIAAIGYVHFHEALTPIRVIGLLAIIFGVVAVNMSGSGH